MVPKTLTFRLVLGVTQSTGRSIGFLEGDDELDAGEVFDDLQEKTGMTVRSRMDWWLSGNNGPGEWFHGFPNDSDHKECFVFKWKQKRQGHRLYGFLCKPWPETNPGFQLCVLNIHATKNEYDTDLTELDRVNRWHASLGAREAIGHTYPEYRRERRQWKN
jgi:hypothetical protein